MYLVGHKWALGHARLPLLLVSGEDISSPAHVVLQEPLEGLTLVLTKLDAVAAQHQSGVPRVSALGDDAGSRLLLHLLRLLGRGRRRPVAPLPGSKAGLNKRPCCLSGPQGEEGGLALFSRLHSKTWFLHLQIQK